MYGVGQLDFPINPWIDLVQLTKDLRSEQITADKSESRRSFLHTRFLDGPGELEIAVHQLG